MVWEMQHNILLHHHVKDHHFFLECRMDEWPWSIVIRLFYNIWEIHKMSEIMNMSSRNDTAFAV